MEDRDYEADVKHYFASIKSRTPTSVKRCLSVIRVFLSENDIEFPNKFWRRLRAKKRGTRAVVQDHVPTNAELARILFHMRAKGRALFLMMTSSGMRRGEIL